ncbi:MAG: M1 family aminopeptidase [Bacteroidota bacterium]
MTARILTLAATLCLASGGATVAAQAEGSPTTRGAATPDLLAERVSSVFADSSLAAFSAWYPFDLGRELVEWAASRARQREAGPVRVLSRTGDTEATLLLGGLVLYGNTGDETIVADDYSGLYTAERQPDGLWRLSDRLGPEAYGEIHSHRLTVGLRPGQGLDVVDTLSVTAGPEGLLLALNHRAEVEAVEVNGQPVEHVQSGGKLWVDLPAGDTSQLVVRHSVDVSREPSTSVNSGRFLADYGHVRNQYYWYPFVDFDEMADATVTVTAPERVLVATDLPQTESVADSIRTVRAQSEGPAMPLSLFYDAGWVPVRRQAGSYQMTVYGTPDFEPRPDTLAQVFAATVDVLSARFGPPPGRSVAVVQQRARPCTSWPFRSNTVIAANTRGAVLSSPFPQPRDLFGHEVAHAWTEATGRARNFLLEGLATYAESILLRETYGDEAADLFWKTKRNNYFAGNFEGRARLADDLSNAGVSYDKGAWVFHMLETAVGQEVFDAGVRAFVSIPPGEPASLNEFIDGMSMVAGRDIRPFLDPWVENDRVPDLRARVEGSDIVLEQVQDGLPYLLDVDIDVVAAGDTTRVTIPLRGPSGRAPLPPLAASVDALLIDPDRRWLIRRHRGERVTLTLDAPEDASGVILSGDFFDRSLQPATYADGQWQVEVALPSGTYFYAFRVAGEWQGITPLVIQPLAGLDPTTTHPD